MSPSMSLVRSKQGALLALLPFLLLGCKQAAKEAPATPVAAEDPAAVHPEIWPSPKWPFEKDAALEEKVATLKANSPALIAAAGDFFDSLRPDQQQKVRDFMAQHHSRMEMHHGGMPAQGH